MIKWIKRIENGEEQVRFIIYICDKIWEIMLGWKFIFSSMTQNKLIGKSKLLFSPFLSKLVTHRLNNLEPIDDGFYCIIPYYIRSKTSFCLAGSGSIL